MNAARPTLPQRLTALAVISFCFVFIYSGTSWITAQRHDVATSVFSWEHHIPFVPWLIVPYWSLDLFFVGSVFVCRTTQDLQVLVKRLIFAIVIAGACFLLFPLRIVFERPPLTGMLEELFAVLERANDFYNAAPSLHIAIRSILWTVYIPATKGALRRTIQGWFVLVGVSTLLCWRHHVIDVIAGQILSLLTIHLIAAKPPKPAPEVDLQRRINCDPALGLRYFAAAGVLLAAAISSWPSGVVLLWPMFAVLIVAAAYSGCGPAMLRKSGGRIPGASRVLLGPYLVAAHLSFLYFTAAQPAYRRAAPGLWFGRKLTDKEAASLIGQGVTSVLDLTAEYDETPAFLGLEYRNVPILDLTAPSTEQLQQAAEFIAQGVAAGGVYVHCSLGRSRSALAVAAYLLAEGLVNSADSAISELERWGAVIKPRWRKALVEFENSLTTLQAA